MRTGLPTGNGYWVQQDQRLLVSKNETARVLGLLELQLKSRSKMSYCNWSYALAGEILERVSGLSLEECTKSLLFSPLGLSTTTFGAPAEENHVTAVITLTDGHLCPYLVLRSDPAVLWPEQGLQRAH
jgi:CubicO group peptidase (beta-lactamase class C family)